MDASPRYCAACGAANAPGAQACFACGAALAAAPTGRPGGAGGVLPEGTLQGPSISGAITGPLPAQPDSTITLPLPAQHLLKGRYRLLGRVGQGGMGMVYRAEDTSLGNRIVAIKEMSARGLSQEELAEVTQGFQREALLLAQLNHPNLPHIYEQFSEGERWYLVMDYIEGETLETHLARAPGGRLSVQETLQLGIQLATVLSYLHSRQPPIVFRDLKPANIMLTLDGRLYLIDFGIARLFKPGQSKDTTPFGSSGYAAPEQYGRAQTTPQADIFSLGATLHQLLSGTDPAQTPFVFAPLHIADRPARATPVKNGGTANGSENAATVVPASRFPQAGLAEGPAGLETLIRQMVATDRTQRPASMEAVRRELQRLAAPQTGAIMPEIMASASPPNGPPPSRPPRAPARFSSGSRRLPRPSVQGCVVGVVLLIFILMIPLSIPLISSAFSGGGPSVAAAPTATPTPTETPTPLPTATDTPGPTATPTPFVNGSAEYLVDAGTGGSLYAVNIHAHLAIASTTKIMTAILAIEDGGDLNQIVPITQAELDEVPDGASVAQLQAGDDNMTLMYLLYALMLPSGSDAAIVIAHQIAGSTDNFVAMMNAKAAALGMNDTHFTSPHGATSDPDHYSSVADLVTLARYAMQNATFAKIVATPQYTLVAQTHRHAYTWDNTNELLGSYTGANGIKTGSLPNWFCIVFSATRNGRTFIGAELGAPTPDLLYGDATRMLDLGFGS